MATAADSHRLHELRAELRAIRERGGYGSASAGKAKFDELCAEANRQGRPLSQLRIHSPDEVERFFARTIPGPSGHVYWRGGKFFFRNDGKSRRPIRWWWQHKYGELDSRLDLLNVCGDPACINPEHARIERVRGGQRTVSDESLFGFAQVLHMRIGRSPSRAEWNRAEPPISHDAVSLRFQGSWARFLRSAGLPEYVQPHDNAPGPGGCIASLRAARDLIGHWPSRSEFLSVADQLKAQGYTGRDNTIRKYLGRWPDAIKAAQDQP